MAQDLTAIVFRPKRQWKPKRRDRDSKRRMKRKQWARKNRSKIRQKQKLRYKQLRKNPAYQKWQAKKRKEKSKRKFRRGSLQTDKFDLSIQPGLDQPDDGFPDNPCLTEGVPDIWFVFSEKPDTIDVDMGYVCDYDPDAEELLIFDVDDQEFKVVGLDDFLEHASLLEEEDWDNFQDLLDRVYEDDSDLDAEEAESSMVHNVTAGYLSKTAFNKDNPGELLNQLIKVMDKETHQAEGKGKKGLVDALSRLKGITKLVQEAWDSRKQE
jgi:hypothetical protein